MGSKPTRRQFLGGAAAGACGALAGNPAVAELKPPQAVQDSYYAALRERMNALGIPPDSRNLFPLTLTLRYLTDPERIERMLPPRLEPDDTPEVALFWFMTVSKPEQGTIFVPDWVYGEADLFVSCRYRGHRCMTALSFPLDQDFGRYAGRIGILMRKKDGRVMIDFDGKRVRAWTSRRGRLLSAIETTITEEPGQPYFNHREVGWGWMRNDYRLHPDWRQGPLDDAPVQLWRVFGFDAGYPSAMPEDRWLDRLPRACDLDKTKIVLGDPDPLDPFGEFPVRKMLGANFHHAGMRPEGTVPGQVEFPRGPDRVPTLAKERSGRILMEEIPRGEFEEWAFFAKGYDRPITRNRVWVPEGFPDGATACRLSTEEISRWRARSAMEMASADIVEVLLAIDRDRHARTLPPPLEPGPRPNIRIVAIRAAESDYSTLPFTEFWLLSACEFHGRPTWFALSHIVDWDGDVFFGRETYGYPTKHGEPRMTVAPMQIDLHGRRLHRDFLRATLPLSLDDAMFHVDDPEVIGMRVISPENGEQRCNYVTQTWTIRIDKARNIWPEQVHLDLPHEPAPANIGAPDPWFDFADHEVVAAKAGTGKVRRYPGRIRDPFDYQVCDPWLRDRDESHFDGARSPSTATFVIDTHNDEGGS